MAPQRHAHMDEGSMADPEEVKGVRLNALLPPFKYSMKMK